MPPRPAQKLDGVGVRQDDKEQEEAEDQGAQEDEERRSHRQEKNPQAEVPGPDEDSPHCALPAAPLRRPALQPPRDYARFAPYVFTREGTFVNARLIPFGFAEAVGPPPNARHREVLGRLEHEARGKRRGPWMRR